MSGSAFNSNSPRFNSQKSGNYLKLGLVKEVIKEIGNKSREFYEFVLPPVDMHLDKDNLKVIIDIPGFSKKDIKLVLCGDILSIKAHKEKDESLVLNQRPNVIDKKIKLPIEIKQGQEQIDSAKYTDGVLTLIIPVKNSGKDISIE